MLGAAARRSLVGLAIALAAIALPSWNQPAGAARGRKTLVGSVPSWATASRLTSGASGRVDLAIALRWRHSQELADFDRSVSDPRSSNYGDYLSAGAFRARFSPSPATVAQVKGYLREQGLRVERVSKSRMLIDAVGSVRDAEHAFHTKLRSYRYRGRALRAPSTPVSVPSPLSRSVAAVVGLDETRSHPLIRSSARPSASVNAPPCSPYWGRKFASKRIPRAYGQAQPLAVCGYDPHQLEGAYGIARLIRSGNDGKGQTVAIVDSFSAPTIVRDVNTYSRRHGLPRAAITKTIDRGCRVGCTARDRQGWYVEETLDLEAVHAMAPGAALAYHGASDASNKAQLDSVARVVDDDRASIVTNSYGNIGQSPPRPYIKAQEQVAQQAAAQGIGLYFASGDEGDGRGLLGRVSTGYPASSPWVTAVGGTSLGIGPLNNHLFELGWGDRITVLGKNGWRPKPPGWFASGSGGGTSRMFNEPSYQLGVVPRRLATRYGGRSRVVPDISMDADSATGMLIGETYTFRGRPRYSEGSVGGTSLSSPLLGGYMALANQVAGRRLGFVNPALYELAGSGAIRDIRPTHTHVAAVVDGFLLESFDHDSTLRTKPGYDNVTGLGSPAGDNLIEALAGN